jgi:hypothetical protein
MRETVFLNIGTFSNFIGAHYLNLLDEASVFTPPSSPHPHDDQDPHDRHAPARRGAGSSLDPGLTPHGARVVIVDRVGHVGDPFCGHREPQGAIDWEGDRLDVINKGFSSEFGSLASAMEREEDLEVAAERIVAEEGVHWGDFLKAVLQRDSIVAVNPPVMGSDLGGRFDLFAEARCLGGEWRAMVVDRVRRRAESCDALQGFQMIVNSAGGFAGIAAEIVAELRDDGYAKKSMVMFAAREPQPGEDEKEGEEEEDGASRDGRDRMMLGEACLLASSAEHEVLHVPMRASLAAAACGETDTSQWFRHTAVLAAAVDTVTMPYRMGDARPHQSMEVFETALCVRPSMRMALLYSAFPLRAKDTTAEALLPRHGWNAATSGASAWLSPLSFPLEDGHPASSDDDDGDDNEGGDDGGGGSRFRSRHAPTLYGAAGCLRGRYGPLVGSEAQHLRSALSQFLPTRHSLLDYWSRPVFVPLPFPTLPGVPASTTELPAMAVVATSPAAGHAIKRIAKSAAKIDHRRYQAHAQADMGKDFVDQVRECLLSMAEAYEED